MHISILNKICSLTKSGTIKSSPKTCWRLCGIFLPLDVLIKSALQLKQSDEVKYHHVGHVTVLKEMVSQTFIQGTDYFLSKFGKTFRTRIPSEEEWATNSIGMMLTQFSKIKDRICNYFSNILYWSGPFCVFQVVEHMHSFVIFVQVKKVRQFSVDICIYR